MRWFVRWGMGLTASVTLLAALILGISLFTAQTAAARPRSSTVNGCTAAQIQSPAAGPCIDQLQKDTVAGVAYPHFLMCDASGMYCCQGDATRTFGCKAVAIVRPPNFSPMVRTPGGHKIAPP